MTVHLILAGLLPFAFLLGSVPFGVLIAKARGVDLRGVGSGNTGATNAGRALGKRYFFVVLALDAAKALVPAAIASGLVHAATEPAERSATTFGLWIAVGLAAVLGHVFSPFLKFKGGKGVACGLGMVLGIFPYLTVPGLLGLATFIAGYKLSRYISVGSIVGAASLPIWYLLAAWSLDWSLARQWPVLLALTLTASLLVWRHRENVRRLIAGTETKAT